MALIKINRNLLFRLLLILSGFLVICFLTSYLFAKVYFHQAIKKSLLLTPNSSQFEIWSNPPIHVLRKYYFFHVQNPNEILNGAKPIFKERGPYVYREILEKRNIAFINKTILKYSPMMSLFFEPSLSVGRESDIITILNVPLSSMVEKLSKEKQFLPLNILFEYFDSELFIARSIKEIVSGYYDPLMDLAKMSSENINNDKFGITLNKNGTLWQEMIVQTVDVSGNTGKVISWNGKNKFDYWKLKNANQFKGKDGTFGQPYMRRDQNLEIFSGEMCRSYTMSYLRENYLDGLLVYNYQFKKDLFSCINLENEGYIDEHCIGNGVFNLSNCQNGVSSFLSQPHFLNADRIFLNSLVGLKPQRDKHDFIVYYEPISGASLGGNVRLQLNFYLKPNEEIRIMKNIKPILFPFFWFDEEIRVINHVKEELKSLRFTIDVINALPLVMLIAAIVSLITAFAINFYKNSPKNAYMTERNSDKNVSTLLLNGTNQK